MATTTTRVTPVVTKIIDSDGHLYERDEDIRPYLQGKYPEEMLRTYYLFPTLDGWRRGIPPRGHRYDAAGWAQFMDAAGISESVLYPTLGLAFAYARDPDWATDLARAYNDYVYDHFLTRNARLKAVALLPLLSMQDALDMLPWCKEHGAVGVFMRPIEGERLLHDPNFDRLYDAVSRLNLCLGVHVANANPRERDLLGQRVAWGGGFWPFLTPVVGACHATITSGLMQRHPGLRIGFIEASGSWLPWVINDIRRRAEGRKLSEHFLEEFRIFVTCYTTDDIGYIARQAGAGVLMIGTDYGHQDMSVELDALRTLGARGDVEPGLTQRILDDNPRALYGL